MREPLDYISPQTAREYSVSPLPTFLAYSIVYLVVGAVMFLAAPNIEAFFANFKTGLPLITQMTLAFGRWFRAIGWLVLLPVPVVVPFALARMRRSSDEPQPSRHWRIVGITSIVLLVLGITMLLSVWLPLMNVMWTVSSPPKATTAK